MNDQSFVFGSIAIGHISAVPKTFLCPLMHLVAGPVRSHFSFKLCKVQKNIAQKTAHRVLRVQTLRDRYEFDSESVKKIHEDMKIFNRTCQAINFVGENAIQLSVAKIAQHLLECGTVH